MNELQRCTGNEQGILGNLYPTKFESNTKKGDYNLKNKKITEHNLPYRVDGHGSYNWCNYKN